MSNLTSQNQPILYEYRCKLCQWANTHPDLFKDIHVQVLEVGSSYNRAMNYINNRIDGEGIDTAKINNQNMSVHFNNHISLPNKVVHNIIDAQSPTPPSLKDVNQEMGSFVEDIVRRKVGNEVNDYLNLDALRSQLMEKLDLIDGLVQKETTSGAKVVDTDMIDKYVVLSKEIRSCIVDLNKIRQSKQLTATIIKSLIEKTTFETVRQLSREYDQIAKDLLQAGVDQLIVTSTDQKLRVRLAEIVTTTARAAIEDVSRAYKLG